jgi:hypothetical protein
MNSSYLDMSLKEQEAALRAAVKTYLELAPMPSGGDASNSTLIAMMMMMQEHNLMLLGRLDYMAEEIELLRKEMNG